MPNIMILAQGVIQIFCWQGLQCLNQKKEIIQPNIHRFLRKVNQVIYTLDTICVSEKGDNLAKYLQNFTKS